MVQIVKCKTLIATFQEDKLFLDRPHMIEFDTVGDKQFRIKVDQRGIRKITITSDENISVFDLHAVLSHIVRLLMLLDGTFITLFDIQLSDSDTVVESVLSLSKEHFMKSRLSYFSSAKYCSYDLD